VCFTEDMHITNRFKSDRRRCDSQEAGIRERSAQDHDRDRSRCNLLFWNTEKKSVDFFIRSNLTVIYTSL